MGFLDQLRMQNIFPPAGGPPLNGGTPFGMPDFSQAQINPGVVDSIAGKALAFHDAINDPNRIPHQNFNLDYHPSNNGMAPGPGGINPAMMQPPTTKPMNTILDPNSFIKPVDREKLNISRDKLNLDKTKAKNANELGQDKLDLAGELGRGKLDVSQQRADALDFKAKHPNAQIIQPKGGNIMLYDPASQTMHDTGVATGTMSQEDLLSQTHGNRMDEINERGDISKDVQGMKGEQNLAGIAAKVAGAKEKQKIGSLPTQQKVDYGNKAQKLINTKPELAPFIKFNTDGTFNIVAPSNGILGGHHGPTEEQYKQISDAIYGSASDINLPSDSKSKVKTEVKPDKDNDPLGIRPKGDDSEFEEDDE